MYFSVHNTEMGTRNEHLCLLLKIVVGVVTCLESYLAAKQENDSLINESGCAVLGYILEDIDLSEILKVKVLLYLYCVVTTDQRLF